MKKFLLTTVIAMLFHSTTSEAIPFVLDFEGVGDGAIIDNFYNGGTDSQGNSGTNFGVHFGSNALAAIDRDAGGNGNFANEPTPNTAMFFETGNAILNYAPGFATGFSFFYSSADTASVNVYDSLDATGILLASLNLLPQHTNNCTGDPTGVFCNWTPVGVAFSGIAKSIDFGGTVNRAGFDDITFGSANPGDPTVPEPATLALLGMGLIGFKSANRRKKI